MRFALSVAVLATTLTAAAPSLAAPATPRCYANVPQLARSDGRARARRLDQLPPAAEIRTVLRLDGPCERPVVVRYGIGGNPAAQPRAAR